MKTPLEYATELAREFQDRLDADGITTMAFVITCMDTATKKMAYTTNTKTPGMAVALVSDALVNPFAEGTLAEAEPIGPRLQ